jgi:hypothetical protein
MKNNHIIMLLILAGTLTMASPSYGQNCSTSITNNIGDTITITTMLNTIDPNENGEGEPLLITTSAGEFTATDPVYGIPQVFSYTASAANETINGTNLGADFDESCNISATSSKPNPPLSAIAKQIASDVAGQQAQIGDAMTTTVALCEFNFITGPICKLFAGKVGALIAVDVLIYVHLAAQIAADPVDNNYTQLAQPVFPDVQLVLSPTVPTHYYWQALSSPRKRDRFLWSVIHNSKPRGYR